MLSVSKPLLLGTSLENDNVQKQYDPTTPNSKDYWDYYQSVSIKSHDIEDGTQGGFAVVTFSSAERPW